MDHKHKKASFLVASISLIAVTIYGAISLAGGGFFGIEAQQDDLTVLNEGSSDGSHIEFRDQEAPIEPVEGVVDGRTYIAPTSTTNIPVYDTAWQLFRNTSIDSADDYFRTLRDFGFTGSWAGILHHAPASTVDTFTGGTGTIGSVQNGEVVLNPQYIAKVRNVMDVADRYGMKLGLVIAWQNAYFPGGGAGPAAVSGSINNSNACAYGIQMVREFGDHPALSMWVLGGDAGTNNTDANKAIWGVMAECMNNEGTDVVFNHHLPTARFGGHLNYTDADWLDIISPETGHNQTAAQTRIDLQAVKDAYEIPFWQGEARYFGINFDWVQAQFRNPGVAEVVADAQAAKDVGASGYVYGDGGRWHWCVIANSDSSPCNANNISESFGEAERQVIELFSD